MLYKKLFLLLYIIILIQLLACCNNRKTDFNETSKSLFLKSIHELPELELEIRRVDSIKKATGMKMKISIDIIGQSFYKEDSLKNIALGFINEDVGFDKKIRYIIKFDKIQEKIIQVCKN